MRIIIKQKDGDGGYKYVCGRGTKLEGHKKLLFTNDPEKARIWVTLYAATDFVCKSDTELTGLEIICSDEMESKSKKPTTKVKAAVRVKESLAMACQPKPEKVKTLPKKKA